jgi:hypothetical protein
MHWMESISKIEMHGFSSSWFPMIHVGYDKEKKKKTCALIFVWNKAFEGGHCQNQNNV